MSSQTNTLTEGPLAKQIFLVSLPLALSNLLVARFYGAPNRIRFIGLLLSFVKGH